MRRKRIIGPLASAVLRAQPDARLVALARDGREAAFNEIVRRYRPGLLAFAAAFAPASEVEDVVQESLLSSWSALRSSTSEIALKPWLYTIVRNRALNARRDTRRHEPLDETIDGVRQPGEIVLQREELDRVVAAVAGLPEQQRRALVASALEGRTHGQIAAQLETSPDSVRGLIHRGRHAVRNAAGAIVPLPLVAALASISGGSAAAGGSLVAKGVAVAALGAFATGSGIAVDQALEGDRGGNEARAGVEGRFNDESGGGESGPGGPPAPASGSGGGGGHEGESGQREGNEGEGSENSGEGSENSGGDGPETENEGPSEDSGPSGSGSDESGSGSGPSGSNSGPSGSGSSGSGGSGPSDSGSGSSGSGSSGSSPET